jgi:hypothetical protein
MNENKPTTQRQQTNMQTTTIQLTIYSGAFAATSACLPQLQPHDSAHAAMLPGLRLVCEKADRLEEFCHLVFGLCGILAIGFALFL